MDSSFWVYWSFTCLSLTFPKAITSICVLCIFWEEVIVSRAHLQSWNKRQFKGSDWHQCPLPSDHVESRSNCVPFVTLTSYRDFAEIQQNIFEARPDQCWSCQNFNPPSILNRCKEGCVFSKVFSIQTTKNCVDIQ